MSQVNVDDALAYVGTTFQAGCSGLVAELLGKVWQKADDYTQGDYIGKNGAYSNVQPGDVIGFPGHVGVYIGQAQAKFVDCPGPNKATRVLKNGYGQQAVYKYSY